MIFVILVPLIVGALFVIGSVVFALLTLIVGAISFIKNRYFNYGTRN
jgi:hypothetical protein